MGKPSSPLEYLRKDRSGYRVTKGDRELKTKAVIIGEMCAYLQEVSSRPNCVDVRGRPTNCSCLNVLKDRKHVQKAVSRALLEDYHDLDARARKLYSVHRLRLSAALQKTTRDPSIHGQLPERYFSLPLNAGEGLDECWSGDEDEEEEEEVTLRRG
mmetsp:Transcript_4146/g.10247  ORF Transcript_4146/g.10247 Transcript_4146/m.10247 type:complete len:156 (-) Transcript_4146:279-746(-)